MKQQILHASHITSKEPGVSIFQAPGPSSPEPDPWRINKMDGSEGKKARRLMEIVERTEDSEQAEEYNQEELAEKRAALEELKQKRKMKYEDLPGTPKQIEGFNLHKKKWAHEVKQNRNFFCDNYNECLGYAAFHNWKNASCAGCEYGK